MLQGAELVKAALNDNGIEAVLMNRQDSSYLQFGEIEVLVKRDDVLRAKYLLDSARNEEE